MFLRVASLAVVTIFALSKAPDQAKKDSVKLVRNQCVNVYAGDAVELTMSPKPRVAKADPKYAAFSVSFQGKDDPKKTFVLRANFQENPIQRVAGSDLYRLTFTMHLVPKNDVPAGDYTLRTVYVDGRPDGTGADSISDLKTNPELAEYCLRYQKS